VLTLWDLIEPMKRALGLAPAKRPGRARRGKAKRRARVKGLPPEQPGARGAAAQERYEAITREMLETHGLRVRKWRRSMSGLAWITEYTDGTVARCVEAPRPRSPMSMAIFLHEVGHHVIGLGTYKPRCMEEYHAWMYALREMEKRGVPVTDRVKLRVKRSLQYAVAKASRRGIRSIPEELRPYLRD
jgi:hypothetical protein